MEQIIKKDIIDDMTKSYVDYSMSVICARALPDVRDGLKPVARRILYAMHIAKMQHNKPYKKAAAVVGNTMGQFHPHGDASIYGAAIRMAQDFSVLHPLVDGHGNIGNVDGDDAAAMRYVKMRMSPISEVMMTNLNKDVVDMTPNYDNSKDEPTVLPSGFPNLLVNGSIGIAVGMATSIPSHNLEELVNGLVALIENPEISNEDIVNKYIQGPDFPSGGKMINQAEMVETYATGRGKATLQGLYHIEEKKGKKYIVFTELPYQVQKPDLIVKIVELVKAGTIAEIQNVYDESDRDGIRFVIELNKSANEYAVLNKLFQYTNLEKNFKIIMLALDNNLPKVFSLKEMLKKYIEHQIDVLIKAATYDLIQLKSKQHILTGFLVALENIDNIIKLIKGSNSVADARLELQKAYKFSLEQANAILNLKLQRLTALEYVDVQNQLAEITLKITDLNEILSSGSRRDAEVTKNLKALKKYFTPRKTELLNIERTSAKETKVIIPSKEVYVVVSEKGLIKTMDTKHIVTQKPKGKGGTIADKKNKDNIKSVFKALTTDKVNVFTNEGRLYRIDVHAIPNLSKAKSGVPILSMLEVKSGTEFPIAIVPNKIDDESLIFITKGGIIKKTSTVELLKSNRSGVIAFKRKEDDEIIGITFAKEDHDVLIFTSLGQCIRFNSKEVSTTNKYGVGVKSIKLKPNDFVVSACLSDDYIVTITDKGFGKKTLLSEYPQQKRYGVGVISHKLSEQKGTRIINAVAVSEKDEIIIANKVHKTIKIKVKDIPTTTRSSAGNKLMTTTSEIVNINLA